MEIKDNELVAIKQILELTNAISNIVVTLNDEEYSRVRSYLDSRQEVVDLPYKHPFTKEENE